MLGRRWLELRRVKSNLGEVTDLVLRVRSVGGGGRGDRFGAEGSDPSVGVVDLAMDGRR